MLLVTVGNATQRFDRLLNLVSEAQLRGVFGDEEVFVQTGSAAGISMPGCRTVKMLSPREFRHAMLGATVVISHCGAGTVLQAIKAGHCPIVMPRLPALGEGLEDQSDLLRALEDAGRVIGLTEGRTIERALEVVRLRKRSISTMRGVPAIVEMVGEVISELMGPVTKS